MAGDESLSGRNKSTSDIGFQLTAPHEYQAYEVIYMST